MNEEEYLRLLESALAARNSGDRNAYLQALEAVATAKRQMAAPQMDRGRGALQQAGQGATLGFLDELAGGAAAAGEALSGMPGLLRTGLSAVPGMGAMPGLVAAASQASPETYQQARDVRREEMEAFQAQNPGTSMLARAGGGLMTAIPTGAAAATTALGRAAASLAARSGLLGRLGLAAGLGAAGGATGGAIEGAGEAETLAQVPAEAGMGAVIGGGLGGLFLGPGAELVTTGVRGAVNAARNAFNPARRAASRVGAALQEAGIETAEDAAARLRPGDTLADLGPGPRAETQYLARTPGATGELADDVLSARSGRQAEEIQAAVGPARRTQILDEIQAQRATEAAPLYAQAYQQPTPMNDNLRRLFESPTIKRLWNSSLMRRTAEDISTAERLPYDARQFATDEPSTMGWDYLVRTLDRQIARLKRSDPAGARPLMMVRREIMDEIGEANPTLAQARSAWAGGERYKELMDEGMDIFRGSSADFEASLRTMGETEREAVGAGVAQAIRDKLERGGDLHDMTKSFNTEGMRRKMRALLGDARAETFDAMINRLANQQRTFSQVRPGAGSPTAPIMLRDEQRDLAESMGAVGELLTGNWRSLGLRVAAGIDPTAASRQATRDAAGRMMLETNPLVQQQIVQQALAATPQGAPALLRPGLTPALVGAAGGTVAPLLVGN